MSAFLLVSLAAIASAALLMTAVAVVLFRTGVRPLGYWLFAWSALLEAGILILLVPRFAEVEALVPIFSTFVAPFMLLGAFAHSGRNEPIWLVAVAFGAGVARSALHLVGMAPLAWAIPMVGDPILGLISAWLVLHPVSATSERRARTRGDLALAVGFVFYAGVEFFDSFDRLGGTFGWPNWVGWLAVGVPLSAGQLVLHLGRIGGDVRRQAAELHEQSMRLETLSRSSLDSVVEFDERGRITFVAPGMGIATGIPAEGIVGRSILDFLDPDSPSIPNEILASGGRFTARDLAKLAEASHRVFVPGGEARWYQIVASHYDTTAGRPRFIVRIIDVTERSEDDQHVRKSEARLRRAEHIAGVGSFEFDYRTLEATLSDEARRILGIGATEEPVTNRDLLPLIHAEDLEPVMELWRRARDEGVAADLTVRITRPDDGRGRNLRLRIETDRDGTGRMRRMVGAMIDVTDQIELTKRLRENERRFQALIDSNIVCVFSANLQGRIWDANDAFLSLFGYQRSDLPIELERIITPERIEPLHRTLAQKGFPQPPALLERELVTRDGRRVPMLLTYALLPPDDAIVIAIDQSERRAIEILRERQRGELEETVALRTRELVVSRNRLIEQERLVAVGTLAAGVAHQINNPIGGILNSSEFALLCRDDADVLAIYERALRDNRDEARRCAQIVRSMLQFSRDQPTAKWPEDLASVVRRAMRAITAYAQDRSATLTFGATHERIVALISPIALEQAIVNVMRNAIESRDSGVKVAVVLSRSDKYATIETTDDGRGIAPEHLDHLFEPFFSTRTREGGTGLGLSVTHGIVTDHGGRIHVESIPDMGTRVVLTLPIQEATDEATDEAIEDALEDGPEGPIPGD